MAAAAAFLSPDVMVQSRIIALCDDTIRYGVILDETGDQAKDGVGEEQVRILLKMTTPMASLIKDNNLSEPFASYLHACFAELAGCTSDLVNIEGHVVKRVICDKATILSDDFEAFKARFADMADVVLELEAYDANPANVDTVIAGLADAGAASDSDDEHDAIDYMTELGQQFLNRYGAVHAVLESFGIAAGDPVFEGVDAAVTLGAALVTKYGSWQSVVTVHIGRHPELYPDFDSDDEPDVEGEHDPEDDSVLPHLSS